VFPDWEVMGVLSRLVSCTSTGVQSEVGTWPERTTHLRVRGASLIVDSPYDLRLRPIRFALEAAVDICVRGLVFGLNGHSASSSVAMLAPLASAYILTLSAGLYYINRQTPAQSSTWHLDHSPHLLRHGEGPLPLYHADESIPAV
jgi:hypothetical protein